MVAALLRRGDSPVALVRAPERVRLGVAVEVRSFDPNAGQPQPSSVEGLDAIINLAGEPIAGKWTPEKRRAIRDSRVLGTRALVSSIAACDRRPRALVSASAAGYYGSRDDVPLDEDAAPGSDFLAGVCSDWEREATAARAFGVRAVCLRQGIVLGAGGGALAAMLPPFKLGVGGPLGSGRQWWPWIHIDDDVGLFLFALDREDLHGPINAVSPDYATNARLSQALGHALRRPSLAPAPGLALKVILGEFAHALLSSQLILAARAEDLGFEFAHESLDEALLDQLAPGSRRRPSVHRLEHSQVVNAPLDEVFFLLARTKLPVELRRGAILDSSPRVLGFPLRSRSLIARWRPGAGFAILRLRGSPLFVHLRHEVRFERQRDGTLVHERMEYALALAPLTNLALPFVRKGFQDFFERRSHWIGEAFHDR